MWYPLVVSKATQNMAQPQVSERKDSKVVTNLSTQKANRVPGHPVRVEGTRGFRGTIYGCRELSILKSIATVSERNVSQVISNN